MTIIVYPFGHWVLTASLTAAATAATFWAATRQRAHPANPRVLAVAAAAVLLVAVVVPPQGSRDIWSYVMVGRSVAVHHANPYLNPPGTFRHDPYLHDVGSRWQKTTTPYGPVFTTYATIVAGVAGSHPLVARLGFQFGAALAVAAALWLLWRTTGLTGAVVLVALHPVVIVSTVNGGHNDAFAGLAILGAVLLAHERKFAQSGWVLAIGTLVKLTAGLALVPLVAWTWARHGRRAASALMAPVFLLAVPLTFLIPGSWHSIATANAGIVSRTSPWNLALVVRAWASAPFGPHGFAPFLTKVALLCVAALALLAALHVWRSRSALDRDVATATSGWLFAGAYTLPWYALWSLPVAALEPATPITALIVVEAGFLAASNAIPRAYLSPDTLLGASVRLVVPMVVLLVFLGLLFRRFRRPAPEVAAV
jgi:alpha-1,6-mannosyltransferase